MNEKSIKGGELGINIIGAKAIDISEALRVIAKKLENQNINWVIITSCSLALHGLKIEPRDIDIITNETGIFKISHLLYEFKLDLFKNDPSDIFDSTMSKFLINNCCIEVMCNFKVKSSADNQWHSMEKLLEYPDIIEADDIKIPVLALSRSIELYNLMGRGKDILKVQEIEQYMNQCLSLS
jgi:hypothetical protein